MEETSTQDTATALGVTATPTEPVVSAGTPQSGNGFTELMAGYDSDNELQALFPRAKEAGLDAKGFNELVPDETKESLKNIFQKLGFNQKQANAAMVLCADSYGNGMRNGEAPYLKEKEAREAETKARAERDAENAKLIASEEFSKKSARSTK